MFVARAGDAKTLEGHWCPDWKYERLLEEVYLPWQNAQEAPRWGDRIGRLAFGDRQMSIGFVRGFLAKSCTGGRRVGP